LARFFATPVFAVPVWLEVFLLFFAVVPRFIPCVFLRPVYCVCRRPPVLGVVFIHYIDAFSPHLTYPVCPVALYRL